MNIVINQYLVDPNIDLSYLDISFKSLDKVMQSISLSPNRPSME